MDLNKIHYFFKAVEYKNFTQAANACHIGQTTMSKYIAVLEQELQTQLFIREHRTLTLTQQGKQFYEGMKDIYASYQTLCQNIQQTNTLHIGMKTTDFTDFEMLESFEKKYPHLSISYSYLEEDELIEGLKAHQLDALITPSMLSFYKNKQIETTTLSKGKVSLVCSKELIKQYQTIEKVIEAVPFITKTQDQNYHQLCKDELYKLYHASFKQVEYVKEFPKQLLLLNLSRGFSILPTKEIGNKEQFYLEDISDVFSDYEKINLVYLKQNKSDNLNLLIQHIHEKKC